MSKSDSAAHQSAATTRRIDPGRLTRALTDSMTVRDHGEAQYLVARDGDHEEHLVDVAAGVCDCEDAHYRDVVCIHLVRAAVHQAFRSSPNTRLVARVLAAVGDVGCPHDNDCAGPCGTGTYPCPSCVGATNTGDWTVWTKLIRDVGGER